MSSSGNPAQPQDTPQVEVVANPNLAGNAAFAGRNNSALELAGSLRELSPTFAAFGVEYERQAQQRAQADAQKAALTNKGMNFAEAVRQGKIDPTASPFWMAAYKNEAAKVATNNFANQYRIDSATDPDQSNPEAFAAKTQKAFADFGQQFAGPEESAGFTEVAHAQMDNILAGNTEKNVQELQETRLQNLSSLTTQAVLAAKAAAGGHPTGAQLEAAMEPTKQQWLNTGGRLPDWNQKVALPSVISAAEGSQDPNFVDVAKGITNGGGGSLYDIAGAAPQLENIRHRIEQENRLNQSLQLQAEHEKVFEQSLAAQGGLLKMIGPAAFSGGLTGDTLNTVTTALVKQYGPAAAAEAIRSLGEISNTTRELNANAALAYEHSGIGSQTMSRLFVEAKTQGYSDGFASELGQMALKQQITPETQQRLLDEAFTTTQRNSTAIGTGYNRNQAARNIRQWESTRDSITGMITMGVNSISRDGQSVNPTQRQSLQDQALGAASDYLETHPKDFSGASVAAMRAIGIAPAASTPSRPNGVASPQPATKASADPMAGLTYEQKQGRSNEQLVAHQAANAQAWSHFIGTDIHSAPPPARPQGVPAGAQWSAGRKVWFELGAPDKPVLQWDQSGKRMGE